MHAFRRSLPVLVALVLVTGCSSSPKRGARLPDDAVITYAFQDASVPPPYHRSFRLTVDKKRSHLVVRDYANTLADRTTATSATAWRKLVDGYPEVAALKPETIREGCTGGTGITVTVTASGRQLASVDASVCAQFNQTLAEVARTWIDPALAQFPPISELAP